MQNDHCARTIRKLGECGFQPLPQLAAFSRIAEGTRHGVRELLRVPYFTAPSKIESCVGDNAIQPGAECLRRIEPIQRLMRAQKSVLHRIFGIFVRQHDRARDSVRSSLMLPNESGETPIVTCLGKANELPFLIRNTVCGVGLLGGQTRLSRALVVSYPRLTTAAAGIDASQAAS